MAINEVLLAKSPPIKPDAIGLGQINMPPTIPPIVAQANAAGQEK